MKDTVSAGVIAGIVSSIVLWTSEWIMNWFGVLSAVSYRYVELLILPENVFGPVAAVGVVFSALAASAFFGVLQAYVYRLTGCDYWWVKACAYGGVLFIVHVSLIPKLWEPRLLALFTDPFIVAWEVIARIGWGLGAGWMALRWMKRAHMVN